MGQEIKNALVELGAVIESEDGFNLDESNDNSRIDRALEFLKSVICPHSSKIIGTLDHRATIVIALIGDTTAIKLVGTDWPIASISREICTMGIENFCNNPSIMINK